MSDEDPSADDVRGHGSYRRAAKRAEQYRENPEKLKDLVDQATNRAGTKLPRNFEEIRDSVFTLFRLVKAYAKKEYTDVPWKSIGLIVGTLLYFVMPIDLIPDIIPVLGLADDVALLAWTIKQVNNDLERFREWEDSQPIDV